MVLQIFFFRGGGGEEGGGVNKVYYGNDEFSFSQLDTGARPEVVCRSLVDGDHALYQ